MSALSPVTRPPQRLSALLAGLAPDIPDVEVDAVAIDSRAVAAGSLFMAYPGTRAHGLDHAAQAVASGAGAIAWDAAVDPCLEVPNVRVEALARQAGLIASRFYGCPSQRLFVAGITGTDGKTSCAWLLARALDALGDRCGYLGTLGFGFTDDLAPATHTTPDPVRLQDWLARLEAASGDAVAFEVSSHALDQYRVDGVAFDVAVLTQLGRDHLDYHGDMARYAAAKQRLFGFEGLRHAVLNADDAHGRAWLAELDAGVEPIVYGEQDLVRFGVPFLRIARIRAHGDGLELLLDTSWGDARLASPLVGRFNAMNLAAVLGVLLARGYPLGAAVSALATIEPVPGRMQRVDTGSDQPLVVVDYAHTAGALTHALAAVREHADARLICVFGCGGDRDRGKRPLMGAAAVAGADSVWLTSDNPRSESPQSIVDEILGGIDRCAGLRVELDREAAIRAAIASAGPGDTVLIAGKGHETTQEVAGAYREFDDRVVARRVLEGI